MHSIQMVISMMAITSMVLEKAKENTYLPTAISMKAILKTTKNTGLENLSTKIKENIMVFVIFI